MLLPFLTTDDARLPSVQVGDHARDGAALRADVFELAPQLAGADRVAVLVGRDLPSVVGVLATLAAGATAVPINAGAGPSELEHQLADCAPSAIVAGRAAWVHAGPLIDALPATDGVPRITVADEPAGGGEAFTPVAVDDDRPALVMYTSGTTGPPKGAVLSHRAVAANLDMLATAWRWTDADTLVHALPLYHVHGLVLGVLGPLRRGGDLRHLGDFDPGATVAAIDRTLDGDPSRSIVHFGVPTIYHRLAAAAERDAEVADALRRCRLLVSGSAGLPMPVHERIRSLTGHTIVERYGMTETMITTAVPAGREDKAGTVGAPLEGVELRVVDEQMADVARDGSTMGEIVVRTPALFDGYLHQPETTAASFRDGWFATGDTATLDADGYVRIRGRSSTDIIKSGGFKIGAGEIEDVLLAHDSIAEAAVRGVEDAELGEVVAAWVVPADGRELDGEEVRTFTATRLSRHKRPRIVYVVPSLPRNGLGKVQKHELVATEAST